MYCTLYIQYTNTTVNKSVTTQTHKLASHTLSCVHMQAHMYAYTHTT